MLYSKIKKENSFYNLIEDILKKKATNAICQKFYKVCTSRFGAESADIK